MTISSRSPKVSVIMPVYNTAFYLRGAIDSLCQQTLQDIEIILINDGSTDNCQEIIEEYAQKDKRIIWRRQINQGQGAARNNGVLLATGEYIYFMDSDDLLKKQALEICYLQSQQDQTDIVIFDAKSFGESHQHIPDYDRHLLIDSAKIWTGKELLIHELKNSAFSASSCLCFFHRNYFMQAFTGYPVGVIHEDQYFVFEMYIQAQRIRYIPQLLYERRIRPESIMTKHFSMKNIEGYGYICDNISKLSLSHPEWDEAIKLYLSTTLNAIIWLGHTLRFAEKIETLLKFRRLSFTSYISFKNWIVFWLKPHHSSR